MYSMPDNIIGIIKNKNAYLMIEINKIDGSFI